MRVRGVWRCAWQLVLGMRATIIDAFIPPLRFRYSKTPSRMRSRSTMNNQRNRATAVATAMEAAAKSSRFPSRSGYLRCGTSGKIGRSSGSCSGRRTRRRRTTRRRMNVRRFRFRKASRRPNSPSTSSSATSSRMPRTWSSHCKFMSNQRNSAIPCLTQIRRKYELHDYFPFSSDRSIYHALGYSVFMYLKAVMTFEMVS